MSVFLPFLLTVLRSHAWLDSSVLAAASNQRVDFEGKVITGQRHTPGSVVLYQREAFQLPSMVQLNPQFTPRSIKIIFD